MNQLQSNTAASSVRRIHTLEEHRSVLRSVLTSAKDRVLIVSPFVSNSALTADNIPSLITSAVGRNVQVAIYIDDLLNREADGTLKKSAEAGISSLINAGAKVTVVGGIHNKTLARDTNLIAEGSFNWLSAVRTAGGTHQREERTMIVEGDEVASMIEKELLGLAKQGGSVQTMQPEETKTWNASAGHWIFAVTLLIIAGFILAASVVAGLVALCVVFKYMYFLSETQTYTVKQVSFSEAPSTDGEDDESLRVMDADIKLPCDARMTAGYIGMFSQK